MNSLDVSIDQLRRALEIKEQIDALQSHLTSLLSGAIQNRQSKIHNGTGRRTMSASARARIAAAQRARWGRQKGISSPSIQNVKSKIQNGARPRRKMSAAGRAAIAAAARARWARHRAGR